MGKAAAVFVQSHTGMAAGTGQARWIDLLTVLPIISGTQYNLFFYDCLT
jgi:hypothetical protein